ncbi:MAG: aspartate dehydrogenase [Candidatus Freyarchaeota archaeon]|nr:aspartate dehydrogenase [Candidatus Freyrarchaeum guaymaensis]
MIRVAIVGCGVIGGILARAIDEGRAGDVELVYLFDLDGEKARRLADSLKRRVRVAGSIDEIVRDETVNLVVEAAAPSAVKEYGEKVLMAGKDLMVLSVGAFHDQELYDRIVEILRERDVHVYIPSGAISGLDAVKAAAMEELEVVELVTRKPPRAFKGNRYVESKGIDLDKVTRPTVLFEGSAREAAPLFPKGINVALSLSLAGIGADRTKVKVIADPTINRNVHEIHAKGSFGRLLCVTHNYPSPENPETSYLAALSAVRTLRNLTEKLRIGT